MIEILKIFGEYCDTIEHCLPDKNNSFKIGDAVNVVLYIIGVVAVVMVIYSGILYITAAGDAAKLAKAKTSLIWAIVGIAVVVLSYVIVNFVIGAFS